MALLALFLLGQAFAPLRGLPALLAIRWEPSGYDVDAEDFRGAVRVEGVKVR